MWKSVDSCLVILIAKSSLIEDFDVVGVLYFNLLHSDIRIEVGLDLFAVDASQGLFSPLIPPFGFFFKYPRTCRSVAKGHVVRTSESVAKGQAVHTNGSVAKGHVVRTNRSIAKSHVVRACGRLAKRRIGRVIRIGRRQRFAFSLFKIFGLLVKKAGNVVRILRYRFLYISKLL